MRRRRAGVATHARADARACALVLLAVVAAANCAAAAFVALDVQPNQLRDDLPVAAQLDLARVPFPLLPQNRSSAPNVFAFRNAPGPKNVNVPLAGRRAVRVHTVMGLSESSGATGRYSISFVSSQGRTQTAPVTAGMHVRSLRQDGPAQHRTVLLPHRSILPNRTCADRVSFCALDAQQFDLDARFVDEGLERITITDDSNRELFIAAITVETGEHQSQIALVPVALPVNAQLSPLDSVTSSNLLGSVSFAGSFTGGGGLAVNNSLFIAENTTVTLSFPPNNRLLSLHLLLSARNLCRAFTCGTLTFNLTSSTSDQDISTLGLVRPPRIVDLEEPYNLDPPHGPVLMVRDSNNQPVVIDRQDLFAPFDATAANISVLSMTVTAKVPLWLFGLVARVSTDTVAPTVNSLVYIPQSSVNISLSERARVYAVMGRLTYTPTVSAIVRAARGDTSLLFDCFTCSAGYADTLRGGSGLALDFSTYSNFPPSSVVSVFVVVADFAGNQGNVVYSSSAQVPCAPRCGTGCVCLRERNLCDCEDTSPRVLSLSPSHNEVTTLLAVFPITVTFDRNATIAQPDALVVVRREDRGEAAPCQFPMRNFTVSPNRLHLTVDLHLVCSTLASAATYTIEIPTGAVFNNDTGAAMGPIARGQWRFFTGPQNALELVARFPEPRTSIAFYQGLRLMFNRGPLSSSTGALRLFDMGTSALLSQVPCTLANFSGSEVTFPSLSWFDSNTPGFLVEVDEGCVRDESGITNQRLSWVFNTGGPNNWLMCTGFDSRMNLGYYPGVYQPGVNVTCWLMLSTPEPSTDFFYSIWYSGLDFEVQVNLTTPISTVHRFEFAPLDSESFYLQIRRWSNFRPVAQGRSFSRGVTLDDNLCRSSRLTGCVGVSLGLPNQVRYGEGFRCTTLTLGANNAPVLAPQKAFAIRFNGQNELVPAAREYDEGQLTSRQVQSPIGTVANSSFQGISWISSFDPNPVPVLPGDFIKVDVDQLAVCGLTTANQLRCFTTFAGYPTLVNTNVSDFCMCSNITCALSLNRTWVECVSGGFILLPPSMGDIPPGNYSAISCGFDYVCTLDVASDIRCYGFSPPANITGSGPFVRLATGFSGMCGVRADGSVQCRNRGAGVPTIPDRVRNLALGDNFTSYTEFNSGALRGIRLGVPLRPRAPHWAPDNPEQIDSLVSGEFVSCYVRGAQKTVGCLPANQIVFNLTNIESLRVHAVAVSRGGPLNERLAVITKITSSGEFWDLEGVCIDRAGTRSSDFTYRPVGRLPQDSAVQLRVDYPFPSINSSFECSGRSPGGLREIFTCTISPRTPSSQTITARQDDFRITCNNTAINALALSGVGSALQYRVILNSPGSNLLLAEVSRLPFSNTFATIAGSYLAILSQRPSFSRTLLHCYGSESGLLEFGATEVFPGRIGTFRTGELLDRCVVLARNAAGTQIGALDTMFVLRITDTINGGNLIDGFFENGDEDASLLTLYLNGFTVRPGLVLDFHVCPNNTVYDVNLCRTLAVANSSFFSRPIGGYNLPDPNLMSISCRNPSFLPEGVFRSRVNFTCDIRISQTGGVMVQDLLVTSGQPVFGGVNPRRASLPFFDMPVSFVTFQAAPGDFVGSFEVELRAKKYPAVNNAPDFDSVLANQLRLVAAAKPDLTSLVDCGGVFSGYVMNGSTRIGIARVGEAVECQITPRRQAVEVRVLLDDVSPVFVSTAIPGYPTVSGAPLPRNPSMSPGFFLFDGFFVNLPPFALDVNLSHTLLATAYVRADNGLLNQSFNTSSLVVPLPLSTVPSPLSTFRCSLVSSTYPANSTVATIGDVLACTFQARDANNASLPTALWSDFGVSIAGGDIEAKAAAERLQAATFTSNITLVDFGDNPNPVIVRGWVRRVVNGSLSDQWQEIGHVSMTLLAFPDGHTNIKCSGEYSGSINDEVERGLARSGERVSCTISSRRFYYIPEDESGFSVPAPTNKSNIMLQQTIFGPQQSLSPLSGAFGESLFSSEFVARMDDPMNNLDESVRIESYVYNPDIDNFTNADSVSVTIFNETRFPDLTSTISCFFAPGVPLEYVRLGDEFTCIITPRAAGVNISASHLDYRISRRYSHEDSDLPDYWWWYVGELSPQLDFSFNTVPNTPGPVPAGATYRIRASVKLVSTLNYTEFASFSLPVVGVPDITHSSFSCVGTKSLSRFINDDDDFRCEITARDYLNQLVAVTPNDFVLQLPSEQSSLLLRNGFFEQVSPSDLVITVPRTYFGEGSPYLELRTCVQQPVFASDNHGYSNALAMPNGLICVPSDSEKTVNFRSGGGHAGLQSMQLGLDSPNPLVIDVSEIPNYGGEFEVFARSHLINASAALCLVGSTAPLGCSGELYEHFLQLRIAAQWPGAAPFDATVKTYVLDYVNNPGVALRFLPAQVVKERVERFPDTDANSLSIRNTSFFTPPDCRNPMLLNVTIRRFRDRDSWVQPNIYLFYFWLHRCPSMPAAVGKLECRGNVSEAAFSKPGELITCTLKPNGAVFAPSDTSYMLRDDSSATGPALALQRAAFTHVSSASALRGSVAAIRHDARGHLFVVGTAVGNLSLAPHPTNGGASAIYLSRFPRGDFTTPVFEAFLNPNISNLASCFAVDNFDGVYIAATLSGQVDTLVPFMSGGDPVLVKMSAINGSVMWIYQASENAPGGRGMAVAVSSLSHVFFAYFYGDELNGQLIVTLHSPHSGNLMYYTEVPTSLGVATVTDMKFEPRNNRLILGGSIRGNFTGIPGSQFSRGDFDAFVLMGRHRDDGQPSLTWTSVHVDGGAGFDSVTQLAVMYDDDSQRVLRYSETNRTRVLAVGRSTNTTVFAFGRFQVTDSEDSWFLYFDSEDLLSASATQVFGNFTNRITAVDVDPTGRVVVAGFAQGHIPSLGITSGFASANASSPFYGFVSSLGFFSDVGSGGPSGPSTVTIIGTPINALSVDLSGLAVLGGSSNSAAVAGVSNPAPGNTLPLLCSASHTRAITVGGDRFSLEAVGNASLVAAAAFFELPVLRRALISRLGSFQSLVPLVVPYALHVSSRRPDPNSLFPFYMSPVLTEHGESLGNSNVVGSGVLSVDFSGDAPFFVVSALNFGNYSTVNAFTSSFRSGSEVALGTHQRILPLNDNSGELAIVEVISFSSPTQLNLSLGCREERLLNYTVNDPPGFSQPPFPVPLSNQVGVWFRNCPDIAAPQRSPSQCSSLQLGASVNFLARGDRVECVIDARNARNDTLNASALQSREATVRVLATRPMALISALRTAPPPERTRPAQFDPMYVDETTGEAWVLMNVNESHFAVLRFPSRQLVYIEIVNPQDTLRVSAITGDGQGNLLVAGQQERLCSEVSCPRRVFLVGLFANCSKRWESGMMGEVGEDGIYGSVTDEEGYSYLVGGAQSDIEQVQRNLGGNSASDVFVMKMSMDGTFVWLKLYGGATTTPLADGSLGDVAVDASLTRGGGLLVAGVGAGPFMNVSTPVGVLDGIVFEVNRQDGALRWATQLGATFSPPIGGVCYALAATQGSDSAAYVTGMIFPFFENLQSDTLSFDFYGKPNVDIVGVSRTHQYAVRLNPQTHAVDWARVWSSGGTIEGSYCSDVAVDAFDRVYVLCSGSLPLRGLSLSRNSFSPRAGFILQLNAQSGEPVDLFAGGTADSLTVALGLRVYLQGAQMVASALFLSQAQTLFGVNLTVTPEDIVLARLSLGQLVAPSASTHTANDTLRASLRLPPNLLPEGQELLVHVGVRVGADAALTGSRSVERSVLSGSVRRLVYASAMRVLTLFGANETVRSFAGDSRSLLLDVRAPLPLGFADGDELALRSASGTCASLLPNSTIVYRLGDTGAPFWEQLGTGAAPMRFLTPRLNGSFALCQRAVGDASFRDANTTFELRIVNNPLPTGLLLDVPGLELRPPYDPDVADYEALLNETMILDTYEVPLRLPLSDPSTTGSYVVEEDGVVGPVTPLPPSGAINVSTLRRNATVRFVLTASDGLTTLSYSLALLSVADPRADLAAATVEAAPDFVFDPAQLAEQTATIRNRTLRVSTLALRALSRRATMTVTVRDGANVTVLSGLGPAASVGVALAGDVNVLVEVNVSSQSGVSRVHALRVVRLSFENRLSHLSITNPAYPLSPSFVPGPEDAPPQNDVYNVSVPFTTNNLTFIVRFNRSTLHVLQVTPNGPLLIGVNITGANVLLPLVVPLQNVFLFEVTAQSGDVRVYEVHVSRQRNDVADFGIIRVNDGNGFRALGGFENRVEVEKTQLNATFRITPPLESLPLTLEARFAVDEHPPFVNDSFTVMRTLPFVGPHILVLRAIADNQVNFRVRNLTIVRKPSEDANLIELKMLHQLTGKQLVLLNLTGSRIALPPGERVDVAPKVRRVLIRFRAADEDATVSVNGVQVSRGEGTSDEIALPFGPTRITVRVVAEVPAPRVVRWYNFTVVRASPTPPLFVPQLRPVDDFVERRVGHAGEASATLAIFCGGAPSNTSLPPTGQCVAYDGNAWLNVTHQVEARSRLAAAVTGERFILFAGGTRANGDPFAQPSANSISDRVEIFDTQILPIDVVTAAARGQDSELMELAAASGRSQHEAREYYKLLAVDPARNARIAQPRQATLSGRRTDMAVAVYAGIVFLGGGLEVDDTNAVVVSGSIDRVVVDNSSVSATRWGLSLSSPRTFVGACAIDDPPRLFFAGGIYANGSLSSVVEVFDPSGGGTRLASETLLVPRFGVAAASYGALALFFGGATLDGRGGGDWAFSDLLEVYNATTGSWYSEVSVLPRAFVTVVVQSNNIAFFGGLRIHPNVTLVPVAETRSPLIAPSAAIDNFRPSDRRWSFADPGEVETLMRSGARGAYIRGEAVFFGGVNARGALVSDMVVMEERVPCVDLAECNFNGVCVGEPPNEACVCFAGFVSADCGRLDDSLFRAVRAISISTAATPIAATGVAVVTAVTSTPAPQLGIFGSGHASLGFLPFLLYMQQFIVPLSHNDELKEMFGPFDSMNLVQLNSPDANAADATEDRSVLGYAHGLGRKILIALAVTLLMLYLPGKIVETCCNTVSVSYGHFAVLYMIIMGPLAESIFDVEQPGWAIFVEMGAALLVLLLFVLIAVRPAFDENVRLFLMPGEGWEGLFSKHRGGESKFSLRQVFRTRELMQWWLALRERLRSLELRFAIYSRKEIEADLRPVDRRKELKERIKMQQRDVIKEQAKAKLAKERPKAANGRTPSRSRSRGGGENGRKSQRNKSDRTSSSTDDVRLQVAESEVELPRMSTSRGVSETFSTLDLSRVEKPEDVERRRREEAERLARLEHEEAGKYLQMKKKDWKKISAETLRQNDLDEEPEYQTGREEDSWQRFQFRQFFEGVVSYSWDDLPSDAGCWSRMIHGLRVAIAHWWTFIMLGYLIIYTAAAVHYDGTLQFFVLIGLGGFMLLATCVVFPYHPSHFMMQLATFMVLNAQLAMFAVILEDRSKVHLLIGIVVMQVLVLPLRLFLYRVYNVDKQYLEHLINAREEDLGKRLRDYRRQQLLRQKTQGAGSSVLDLAS